MNSKDNHATSGEHASLPIGTVFLNKYQVVQLAGTGNFARVYECVNVQTKERVAVKILKKGYERDADFECDVLRGITKCDPRDEQGVVKLVERTTYNGLAVIVFKLKGAPLRNARLPMSEADLRHVLQDVGDALSFLHFRVKAVHTDLKPENILAELTHQPTSAGGVRKWSLCDLGSASFYKDGQLDRDLITTRPYRAPEVVLNRGWCFPSDAWSLGCIMYELRTGRKLFDCHTDADHLRMMEERIGAIPSSMRGAARIPQSFTARKPMSLMQEFCAEPEFLSLLLGLLEYEPTKRLRCDAIRSHGYVAATSRRAHGGSATATADMEHLVRNMTVSNPTAQQPLSTVRCNDENAGYRDLTNSKKPSTIQAAPAPLPRAPFATAYNADHPLGGTAMAFRPSSSKNLIPAPLVGAAKRKPLSSVVDNFDDAIPMIERATAHHAAAGGYHMSKSAPSSASNSPARQGVHSARGSPRNPQLISPAYATSAQNMPLSYRLTYL